MALFTSQKTEMATADGALSGREEPLVITASHLVLGTRLTPPFPAEMERAMFEVCPVGLTGVSAE